MENRLMVQEGHLLAVFNSAHRVMHAENRLKERELPILLIPAPRQIKTDCGLALRFSETDRSSIMRALEEEHLLPDFISVYRNGMFETIWTNELPDTPTQGDEE